MGTAIGLRDDFDGASLRRLSRTTKQANQARRLLALAEIYDGGRFFCVTGVRVTGPKDCRDNPEGMQWLKTKYWPDMSTAVDGSTWYADDSVVDRARKYLAKMGPAVSGSAGHSVTFNAACILVLGFGLTTDSALTLLREWNAVCQPPWTEHELQHKINDANKQTGPRNYLRNIKPAKWDGIALPTYKDR